MKFKLPGYFLYSVLLSLLLFACASSGTVTEERLTVEAPEEQNTTVETATIPVLQSESFFISEGVLESEKTYIYNGTRLTSIEMTNSFGEPVEEVRLDYGGTEQPVKRSVYGPEGNLASVRVSTHDEEGNLVREELFNRNDQLQTISEYEYDQEGRRLRWSVKDGGGSLMAYTEYEYEDGKNTRINTFSADGMLRDYFVRTFSGDKLTVEEKFNEKGGPSGKVEYNYSADWLIRKDVFHPNGSRERSVDYKYDEKGSVVQETYRRADDTVEQLIVRTYSYREEEREIER